jgi:two-component system CheB/CheR fusion protein
MPEQDRDERPLEPEDVTGDSVQKPEGGAGERSETEERRLAEAEEAAEETERRAEAAEERAVAEQETADEPAAAEGDEAKGEQEEPEGAAEEPSPEGPDFHVVGIGASAGGLSALQEFFRAVPDEPGIAFIVIQHLAPTHSSHMADILARATAMKVTEARDGTEIEPNHVYTIPPDKFLRIEDGCLALSEPFREEGKQLPIDFLFRSLAQVQRERAVGVVLSGTGSDGTLGIREIRAAGGLTMAQDPETADYASMPHSAISTGAIDYVLGPTQMGERLISYVHRAYPVARQAVQEQEADALERILNVLAIRTRRDFHPYKRSTIRRRIERRMGINQIDDVQAYLDLVRKDEKEATELSREMLIGVTSFFREPEAFETLQEQAIADIVRRKGEQSAVRIWVPGCATGEEAYSVALMMHEMLTEQRKPSSLQVFATDIDQEALEVARRGVYPESIAADVSRERLERFFAKQDGFYKVGEQLRDSLVFAPHDLLNEPPFSNMDLISCRNVLIYLESEAQRKVLDLFAFALVKGGYLFMGRSDAVSGRDNLFETVSGEHRLFRRSSGTPDLMEFPVGPVQREARTHMPTAAQAARLDARRLAELNQRVLLRYFGAAVVLARKSGEIVHFFGPVGRFLEHPTGMASLTIADMADEHLTKRLTPALRKVANTGETVTMSSVVVVREGASSRADVTVTPVPGPAEAELIAIIFEEAADAARARQDAQVPTLEQKGVVGDLQAELRATKEDYRATVEELETANEELRAANEEVTSMNEELQATNEELQSSQEELQSVNEELQTLNDQLNQKLIELREANDDLSNLFRAAGIPTIFVDTKLCIKRVAEPASRVINVKPSDAGRPLSDITHQLIGLDPAERAGTVLEHLSVAEQEVQAKDGKWYLMRAVPYRTADNRIDGVVMTFADVSAVKEAEEEVRELNSTLEKRVADATAFSRQRADKLRQLTLRLTNTEQRERQKLAQQLHDTVQQSMAAARMALQSAAERASEDEMREAIERSSELLRDAIATSRGLTAELCPPSVYTGGLGSSLQWLATHMKQRFGLDAEVQVQIHNEPSSTSRILVYRCVQELLTNVAKHAKTDHADVRVTQRDEMLEVRVRDDGMGFDMGRTEGSLAEGFGLFSIRERIGALGGEVRVESAPGRGTRVFVELPMMGSEELARTVQATAEEETDEEVAALKVRILVADDHEIVRCAIAEMLADQAGLEVVGHAANGEEAIKKTWELLPDVVLMDVRMPVMDGIEATRRICKELPGTVVIGLSARDEEDVPEKLKEAGAMGFVDKAAPPDQLLAALRKFGLGGGGSDSADTE